MTDFTTRVELHDNATWDEYEDLHSEMEKRGFTRTITSDDGVTYQLPWAEYNFEGQATRQQVLDHAKAAAAAAAPKRRRAILVTQSAGRKWIGLDKA